MNELVGFVSDGDIEEQVGSVVNVDRNVRNDDQNEICKYSTSQL